MLLPGDPLSAAAFLAIVAASAYIIASDRTPKALGFAVLTLAAFFVEIGDAIFGAGRYVEEFAFSTPDAAAGGWWRPFTYLFAHADFGHVFGNILVLLIVGPVLEDRIGGRRWVALYLGGGALVVLSHVLLYPTSETGVVGASGAVFAILGALAIVAGKTSVPVPLPYVMIMFRMPVWIMALIYGAINVAYALSPGSGVAWWGHFGGLALGIAAGAWFVKKAPQMRVERVAVDADRLAPLATTRKLQGTLERYRALKGETPDDAEYRKAWLDRFLRDAACPVCGATGLTATDGGARCPSGHEALPPSPSPPG